MSSKSPTNFREFFLDRYFRIDRKYVDISMSGVLSEMAVPLDISKSPIKPDKDDIAFLQQFPPQYWAQALHQRYYDDMKEALKGRQGKRQPTEERIKQLLQRALFSGEYRSLQNVVSDELFYRLQNGEYSHVKGEKHLVDKAAAKLAETEAEKNVPHVDYPPAEDGLPPGYKRYTFKKSRNGNETVSIVAKPMLNRLVHKLERTRGQEHHPDSGLHELGVTHGQYGYDLYGVEEGDDFHPHATRGMPLPTRDEVATRMSDFLGHNSHRMYGDLPEGPDVVWKPVGEGRTMYRDNWSWKKIYNKLLPRWTQQLQTAEPGSITMPDGSAVPPEKGFRLASQLRAAAHKLAMEDVIKMAEDGKLHGPPIPGIAPQGLPVKVKTANGKKVIDAPPLYLPHKKQTIRTHDASGRVKTVQHEVPVVNPAEYLRQVGSEPEDYDENGTMMVDPSQLRGHKNDYVHVPHNDYKKARGYLASGALHVTHNSSGRQHLDPSDPEYQERKEQIESEMGYTSLNDFNRPSGSGDGQYFFDIIKGIWNCINSGCGGMTGHEIEIMKQSVPDLHQMAYQKMMMNLRDEKLDTPSGRRAFARNVASSWAQQDLGKGGGTRRLRRLNQDARDASMDADAEGSSGQTMSLRDTIQHNMKEKDAGDTSRLKQGEKYRPAGQHQFNYHIDNLRRIISELEHDATQVDSDREEAMRLSKSEISDQIAELLGNAIADKAALMFQLQYYLKQLFLSAGSPENEAEFKANQKITEYAPMKAKAKQIVAAFKADQEIQQLLQQPEPQNGEQPMSMAQQDALHRFQVGVIDKLTPDKLRDPATWQMVMKFIEAQPDDVQAVLKAAADKAFGKNQAKAPAPQRQQPAPAAAPQQRTNALIAQKDWFNLANDEYFHDNATPANITTVIGKMEAASQAMPEGIEKEEYAFRIAYLRGLLKQKSQKTPALNRIR